MSMSTRDFSKKEKRCLLITIKGPVSIPACICPIACLVSSETVNSWPKRRKTTSPSRLANVIGIN